jgi:hypothetical protein
MILHTKHFVWKLSIHCAFDNHIVLEATSKTGVTLIIHRSLSGHLYYWLPPDDVFPRRFPRAITSGRYGLREMLEIGAFTTFQYVMIKSLTYPSLKHEIRVLERLCKIVENQWYDEFNIKFFNNKLPSGIR